MTFREFIKRFPDEQHCRVYLYELRFSDGFVCPKCSHEKHWKIGELLFECEKCGRQTSVISGTIFQDTRKPLMDWFIGIWWLSTVKTGASALGLQQVLGLKSYQTSWTLLHKIRKALVNPNRSKLLGTVEIDETIVGGVATGKRGRGAENKVLVIIAAELNGKKIGRCRMAIISDASSDSIHPFIIENIETGNALITDGWRGYNGIEKKGFSRQIHAQKANLNQEELLPLIHLIASLLKRWLFGTLHGAVGSQHLQSYLDEYVFLFNRRKSAQRGLLFYRAFEAAMQTKTITYEELTDHKI